MLSRPPQFTDSDAPAAHHWVYKTAGILHHDISVGNIMYAREDKGGGAVRGVLCDWDLAYDPDPCPQPPKTLKATATSHKVNDEIIVEKHDPNVHVGSCYRTGTRPFMAVDLLAAGEVPSHQYRHDLESFFYVLIWFCAVFDPANHELGHLTNWEMSDLMQIGANKRAFLREHEMQLSLFKRFSDDYQPLVALWIESLIDMFRVVNITRLDAHKDCKYFLARAQANGDASEYQRQAESMQAIKDERNAFVTYEKFMACLRINVAADSKAK